MKKKLIKRFFNIFGIKIYKIPLRKFPFVFWRVNKKFKALLEQIQGVTLVPADRCFVIFKLAKYAANKKGEVAEVGVYKGGTAKIIAKSCSNKRVHLFDTFSGIPKVREIDKHKEGDFADTNVELVSKFLSDCGNVELHPGFFPETAQLLRDTKFCFVYVDVDIYASVKDCLEFFYDKMVPGGIMVFDDWEWEMCPGVKRALLEFFSNKREKPIKTVRNQCMIIKL